MGFFDLIGVPGTKIDLGHLGGGNQPQFFFPEPFAGERPFTGSDVGLGAEQLQPLSQQFIDQIMRRSRGEGLVGFGDQFVDIASERLKGNLAEQFEEAGRRQSSQAFGQGLRGGIPQNIARQREEDRIDALSEGLSEIELQDLQAKRLDRNAATFAQPGVVSQGAGIQGQRASFDLNEYLAEQPTILAPTGQQSGSNLLGAIGGIAGGAFGGPIGAGIGGAIGGGLDSSGIFSNLFGGQKAGGISVGASGANRSFSAPRTNQTLRSFNSFNTF